jgi:hypothetical protein
VVSRTALDASGDASAVEIGRDVRRHPSTRSLAPQPIEQRGDGSRGFRRTIGAHARCRKGDEDAGLGWRPRPGLHPPLTDWASTSQPPARPHRRAEPIAGADRSRISISSGRDR